MFETLGLGEGVTDSRTMGREEMLQAFGNCPAERAEIRARLADVMPKVKKEIVGKFAAVQGKVDRRNKNRGRT